MRRHVIIGRLGRLDRESVPVAPDEVMTRLDLIAANRRLDFGIGRAIEDLERLGIFPSEIGLDLLILAALVHAADTRISRNTESQDSWTREIRLVVPVSDPGLWAETTSVLQRLLNFLTGDIWLINFRQRPSSFASIIPMRLDQIANPAFNSLSLFSGGLDSLIGAIDLLESARVPLLVSHAGDGATSAAQDACFDALKAHYPSNLFDRLRVWMNFPDGLIKGVAADKTTRSRSFLFFAIGVFCGTGFSGNFTLSVPENGLIALNVPLDPLRLGANSTRTTHPFYIARWNDLLEILNIPGAVVNPYWSKTKGEMIAECANAALLRTIIPSSLSCSSPTKGRWRGHGIEHCGYCLPCIIRRAAIATGFARGNDPTTYSITNLKSQALDTRQAVGQQVRSFQLAIKRIQDNPAIVKLLIHKPGPLTDVSPADIAALAEVYRRGMTEVAGLLNRVRALPR